MRLIKSFLLRAIRNPRPLGGAQMPEFRVRLASRLTALSVLAALVLPLAGGSLAYAAEPGPAKPAVAFELAKDLGPLALRRTTLIVRDMDKSLALYRDAIGMTVIYDNIIKRPHKTEKRMQEIRLVFLKANNDFIGVLGLADYEHNNPSHPTHSKPVVKGGFTPGSTVVLFNTTELEKRWPIISAAPGVEILNGPVLAEYPSYDGSSTIKVNVTRFYDPDGYLVEYNQTIDKLK